MEKKFKTNKILKMNQSLLRGIKILEFIRPNIKKIKEIISAL